MLGLAVLLGCLVLALFGRWLAPYDPLAPDMDVLMAAPSLRHPFGTDQIGRDMLSRIIAGTNYSLRTALIATSVAALIGVPLGLLSGYFGGWLGSSIDVLTDALLAFPGILMALAIVTALGPGFTNGMIALGIAFSPIYTRLVRGQVLTLKSLPFVEAARALGASNLFVLVRHVLPNTIAPLIVLSSMSVGGAILAGAGLSYLGLGAQPPEPEWGALMNAGIWLLTAAPWITFFPGLAIMITVLAANLLGDGLRDALDPRQELGGSPVARALPAHRASRPPRSVLAKGLTPPRPG